MELISVLEKLKSESEFSSTNPVFIRINSDDSPCRVYLFYSKQEGSYLGIFHEKGKVILQEKPLIQGLEIDEIEENNKIGTRLMPKQPAQEEVFLSLCKHLAEKLTSSSSAKVITHTLFRELNLWKIFFSKKKGPLSKIEIIGLVGELLTLESLLQNSGKKASSLVEAWLGPQNALHDFKFELFSLEVKTSILSENMRFHISPLSQLTEAKYKTLYIIHQVLSWSKSGQSLNNIIEGIRNILSANELALFLFDETIHTAGYHEIHRTIYEKQNFRFKLTSTNTYHVLEKFPKINGTELNPAILVNSYSIDVNSCTDFLMGEFENLIGELRWS